MDLIKSIGSASCPYRWRAVDFVNPFLVDLAIIAPLVYPSLLAPAGFGSWCLKSAVFIFVSALEDLQITESSKSYDDTVISF